MCQVWSNKKRQARRFQKPLFFFRDILTFVFIRTTILPNLPSALFAQTTNKPCLNTLFWLRAHKQVHTHTLHTSHVAHVHHVGTPVQAILRFVEAVAPRCYDCPRRQQPAGPGAAADQVEVEVAARRGQAVHGQRPLRRLDAEGLVGECPVETETLCGFFLPTHNRRWGWGFFWTRHVMY